MKKRTYLALAMLAIAIGALVSCEKPEDTIDTTPSAVDTTPQTDSLPQTDTMEDKNFVVRWEMFKRGPFNYGENPNQGEGDYNVWMNSDTDWVLWRWTQYGEDSLMHFTVKCSAPSEPLTWVHPGYWPNHTYRYRIFGDSILMLYFNTDNPPTPNYKDIENRITELTDSTISFIMTSAVTAPSVKNHRGLWCKDGTFCRIIHGDLWRGDE